MEDLNDECIHHVLLAGGVLKRSKPSTTIFTIEHQNKRRKLAQQVISTWKKNGITEDAITYLREQNSPVIELYALDPQVNLIPDEVFDIYLLACKANSSRIYLFEFNRSRLFLMHCQHAKVKVV